MKKSFFPPACRWSPCWLLAALVSALGALSAPPDPPPLTGKKWLDMDYGPFLTFSIESPSPRSNLTYKGIAVNLGKAYGGRQNEAIVFDTDLLRYSAGWSGNFLALKSVVFNGEHWAYPHIDGTPAFGNPALPGWGKGGNFADPRTNLFGPLPREYAHWQGLYLHGSNTVFSYRVGSMGVLEMPALESAGDLAAFSRVINLAKSTEDLSLQIAFEEKRFAQVVRQSDRLPAGLTANALAALLPAASANQDASRPGAVSDAGLDAGLVAHWDFTGATNGVAFARSPAGLPLDLHKARLVPGRQNGRALEFRGDTYAGLGEIKDLEFLQHDLSIALWVQPESDGGLLAQTAADGPWVRDGKALFLRQGRLTFDIGWVGALEVPTPLPPGQWAHVAMTWQHQSGTVTLYVNGQPGASGVLKPARPQPAQVWRAGFIAPNFPQSPYLKGRLADLRFYRRCLPPEEVELLAGDAAQQEKMAVLAGLVDAPAGARWLTNEPGHLRLQIPAAATPVQFKILLARSPATNLAAFARLVQTSPHAQNLEPLTHGGPARWPQVLATAGKPGTNDGPYQVDEITAPENNPWHSWMRFNGFDFFSDPSRAAICTWSGDVWIITGLDGPLQNLRWRRFAAGLYEPGGLKIVNDQVYVLARDQITRLHDRNGDGEADWYENFNNDTLNSEHFHEFVFDLQTDANGDFYYLKGARHARDAVHPHNGTFLKVSKDGARTEVLARGFRAPNGLGIGPNGQFFTTDQEGYWMPQNRLNLIQPGRFYGNVWAWFPDGKPKTNDPPMVWVHRDIDRSPSTMIWVNSDRWGPYQDQVLSLSYGVGKIFLVMMETIQGREQGGITELPMDFDTGILRARFHPRDGQLYTCGLFGWSGNKTRDGAFYRVRYTGKPLYTPKELHIARDGVVLRFTSPLQPEAALDPANYSVQIFNYKWTDAYGSPDFKVNGERGRDTLPVKSAALSRDGLTLFLELPGIQPVMQMHLQMNIKAQDGTIIQRYVHNTIHHLADQPGMSWLGAQPILARKSAAIVLDRETSGLAQFFTAGRQQDARPARLAALLTPAGHAPTPFLTPGPFQCRFAGYLKLSLSDTYRFRLLGAGRASLKINGQTALAEAALTEAGVDSPTIALRGGLNQVELEYQSPAAETARVRLLWSTPHVPWEPVPPTVLVHEGNQPALAQAQNLRDARFLTSVMYCSRCHQPASPWAAGAMPELQMEAPALDNCGNQFQIQWLLAWLKSPFEVVAEAIMPKCLQGDVDQMRLEARDVTAYLASLKTATNAAPPWDSAAQNALVAPGEALFNRMGCVACHLFANDKRLDGDTRRSLAHVRSKWQPRALVEFLQAPENNWKWVRMPNFQFTREEAESLAAYVLSRCTERFARDPMGPPKGPVPNTVSELGGSATNGARLVALRGCANCHQIPGISKRADFAALEKVLRPQASGGCLATDRDQRRAAPDFNLTAAQTTTLAQMLRQIPFASLRQDNPSEFSTRQVEALRCSSCHERESSKDLWFQLETLAAGKPGAKPLDEEESVYAEKTIHSQRPHLTWTGEKLRPEWMEAFLAGKITYKPRRKLPARMPAFAAYAAGLAAGLAEEHALEATSPALPPLREDLVPIGRALTQKGALSCVDCHDTGRDFALAGGDTATINFAYVPERLRRPYFDRYLQDPQRLLPGTMMPKFITDQGTTGVSAYYHGDARQQFEAIWNYMRSLKP